MIALVCQRNSERIDLQVPVMIEDFRTGFYYNGTICNYSTGGVYLETDYAPRPGRRIHLKVDGAHHIFPAAAYLAEIRWRQPLDSRSSDYLYGIGTKYC